MNRLILAIIGVAFIYPNTARSQRLNARNGFIGFYSKTALEDIRAENNQVFAVIEPSTKKIAFSLLLKGFVFPKELMQEHFNENYVESDKYPKSTFSGSYAGDVDLNKDGVYKVTVKGDLNLHNTTHPVETPAVLTVKNGHLIGVTEFKAKPEDYNISIPSLVRDKIDKEMTVKVNIDWTITK
ncbi:MAG: YceI family protein [Bacteroidetes bacterium]|nr:YceI family protein [Bacteroidota bacterium]